MDGKVYIGQTRQRIKRRKDNHFACLKRNQHANLHLQNAFNKYGASNFVFEILMTLENCTKEELNNLEIKTIAGIDKKKRYNISLGGCKHSDESRAKATKGLCVGEKHPLAKLNEAQVKEIKSILLSEKKLTKKQIGQLYGVSQSTIDNINSGLRWGHVKLSETENVLISDKIKIKISGLNRIYHIGENHEKAKLNEAQVKEIKFGYLVENKLSLREIAKLYGVTTSTIARIKLNKIWKHIKPLDTQEYPINQPKFNLGEKHYNAKLTIEQVQEIKFIYLLENKLNCLEIGKLYGVHRRTISDIKLGKTWTHIQPSETKSGLLTTLGGSI